MNSVNITGRLTADPEFRQTQSGVACARFKVAVSRPYQKDKEKQESDFISCVAWRAAAEFIARNFSKGDPIEVSGSLRTGSYEKDGVKHFTVDVLVDRASFTISNRSKENGRTEHDTGNTGQPQVSPDDFAEFEEILGDGEVPF